MQEGLPGKESFDGAYLCLECLGLNIVMLIRTSIVLENYRLFNILATTTKLAFLLSDAHIKIESEIKWSILAL